MTIEHLRYAAHLHGSWHQPPQAQSVEQFYKGRSITILVGNSPGGINDISARLVARHIGRFIPGNPSAVVQNNPGAGGVITANRLYHNAEKDGTVLAKFERAVPQLAIQGDPNAQFDPMKFIWLGSLSSYADDAYLLPINASNPVKSDRRDQAGRRQVGHPRRRRLRVEQPHLRGHRQGGARAQHQHRARLYRRGAHVPGDAERRARRPVRRASARSRAASATSTTSKRSAR